MFLIAKQMIYGKKSIVKRTIFFWRINLIQVYFIMFIKQKRNWCFKFLIPGRASCEKFPPTCNPKIEFRVILKVRVYKCGENNF